MIQYLGIKTRFVIFSLICNCGISCSKFQVCHTLCQTSERNSKVSIRIGQRRKSEVFCIFISQIHTNILKCFYCHNIDGFCDCLPDAHESSEFVRVVIVCFISDRKRCIILHGCQRFSSGIECRRIACNDFKSRSRLPAGLCCTVPGTVSRLISTSADNSLYLSGRLIHNRHRHLWLHGNENIL